MSKDATPRPRFEPSPCDGQNSCHPALQSTSNQWQPIISCPAGFPVELFEFSISQLVHHPEYNSTLILRAEILADYKSYPFPSGIPSLDGLVPLRCYHRRLLPRRPGRDSGIDQYCTLYGSGGEDREIIANTLVLTPILLPGASLPYYHPTVSHLAFRHTSVGSDLPYLQMEAVLLPNTPIDPNSRLYRTCLALIDTLHKYGWGALTNFKKRSKHDCLVPREAYQDLYLVMRERHKHLVDEWQEVTDPLKHVYEDIGIATFLMLLWKDTFGSSTSTEESFQPVESDPPWQHWPRPPGGFLDLGCGNGLLTHILTTEGYSGHGIDVRARASWSNYPLASQSNLHVHALDPTIPPSTTEPGAFLKKEAFIIGNHADELTPWVPVLSTLHAASGYLSIPCCAWSFDIRYERTTTPGFEIPSNDFVETLNLGGDGTNTSSYSMYRIWLASLSNHCGWEVETDTLRIPSTRNWAIIGRRRTIQAPEDALNHGSNVRDIVDGVRERGIFAIRKPEGKAGDH